MGQRQVGYVGIALAVSIIFMQEIHACNVRNKVLMAYHYTFRDPSCPRGVAYSVDTIFVNRCPFLILDISTLG